ncbi:DDB1- and CUL4-associated factor 4 [Protopterus annectens]|uniref:DDB1- and CUL4-associated factor 4 n=1 Tax=Protopterus annectens TaxID=7888 RepID=UPI001CFA18FF|nr:DDB1- and CUL4-associated factor 4 [Protopterus annectens]
MRTRNWRNRGHGHSRNDERRHSDSSQTRHGRRAGNNYRISSNISTVSQNSSSNQDVATTSSGSQNSSVPELPGFYYDPEKDRYFRLLPGHNACNPLTREGIIQKEMEAKRLKLLEEEEQLRTRTSRLGLNAAMLVQKRSLGSLNAASYSRLFHELKVRSMKRHKLEVQSSDRPNSSDDLFKMIVADTDCKRLFTVSDVDHGGCKYGIMNLNGLKKGVLAVEMCDNLYFTNRKVNAISWASVTHPDSHILLCLVGIAETPGCVSLLPAALFSNSSAEQPGMLCSFKISTAWSCAWCLCPQADKSFSTGLSRCVLVTDAVTGHRQTFGINSDVLAQQFTKRAPVLYNGCRSGEIFKIDIRQRSQRGSNYKRSSFFQDSAITSLQILRDENYLLAGDMAGKIQLWDLRMSRKVKQYEGHNNEYAYLPVHVNEDEGLITAVGQDCYTRIWSLQDTKLLRTIPSPYPASKDTIPCVALSSCLGGRQALPGMLMAVKQDLYFFSYNSEYQRCQL